MNKIKSILVAACVIFSCLSVKSGVAADGDLIFSDGAVHAVLTWEAGPQVGRESILRLDFLDGATHGAVALEGTLGVQLFMPAMGHGSSPTTVSPVLSASGAPLDGAFRISRMYFTMRGAWEVRVIIQATNGARETQVVQINLP